MSLSSLRIGCTSQVSVHLGRGGLKLNTPFMNLITKGWFPALHPSTTMPSEERALLAVLRFVTHVPVEIARQEIYYVIYSGIKRIDVPSITKL